MAQPVPASFRQAPASELLAASMPAPTCPEVAMPIVRMLGAGDAAAYRALRLDALGRHPTAFRTSLDEEAGHSLEELAARLEADAIVGGFCDGTLCGLAGLEIPPARSKRHKGTLFGVYVCPDRRRAGLGTALVAAVIEHARSRVDQLHAAVVTTAAPARALYRKLGFVPYGIEPRGLKVGDQYFDQELLVLRLDGAATTSLSCVG
jgi:GNAT superfamily N-acetyltransferase